MFRGDVWDVRFPSPVGPRPALVLTMSVLLPRLGGVTVAEVTGMEGPATTHLDVPPEVGVTGRGRSWVNVTALHTVPKGKLRRYRGRLAAADMARVEEAVRRYLDLEQG
ncbi:MAG TPA: type II toxin-antitoxin system PemK/MazF family toxin [Frankiaceae bacterium]|nr:type II toxin-antitoxin system PemK/MazF family toxin [Frankiaceae bacterium]